MKTIKQLFLILLLIGLVTGVTWAIGQSSALAQGPGFGDGDGDGPGFPGRPEGFPEGEGFPGGPRPERGDDEFFEGGREGRGGASGWASFIPILLPMTIVIAVGAVLERILVVIRRRWRTNQKNSLIQEGVI